MVSRHKPLSFSFLVVAVTLLGLPLPAEGQSRNKPKPPPPAKPAQPKPTKPPAGTPGLVQFEEADTLRKAFIALAGANHDYKGHRAKAMHAVKAALGIASLERSID